MRSAERARVHFFCLSKRKEPKKKPPDDLPLAVARGSLRFSPFPARVNSRASPAQTCTRFSPETAAMLGGVNGTGLPIADYGVPRPLGAAKHRSHFRRQARACLTERSEGVHARRKRREAQESRSAAQTKLWGALSFAFFSLGKQRKEGRVCAAARIKRDSAR